MEGQASASAVNGVQNNQNEAPPAAVKVDWPLISTVEVPGDVQNDDVVLEKLGGKEVLAGCIENDNVILNLGDYTVPLVGNVHNTS